MNADHLKTRDAELQALFPYVALLFVALSIINIALAQSKQSKPSQASLLAVLTPTTSQWPQDYLPVFADAQAVTKITTFIRDIARGAVELRNPTTDLPQILSGSLKPFVLDADIGLWLSISKWLTHQHLFYPKVHSYALALDDPQTSTIVLDKLPFSQVSSAISLLSMSSESTLMAIEFTCISSSIVFLSKQFLICTLPFLPTHQVPSFTRYTRTSTPLLITFHQVLSIVCDPKSSLKLQQVHNISEPYSVALSRLSEDLVESRSLRTAFSEKHGLEKWRLFRLALHWEAALLRLGWLERFVITVSHKD